TTQVAGLTISAAILALGLLRLRAAVLTWILLGGLVTFDVYTQRNAAIRLSTVVLSGLLIEWGVRQLRRRTWPVPESRLTRPLFVLAGVAVVSSIQGVVFYDGNVAGGHRHFAAEIYATALYGLSIATTFLVAAQIDSRAALANSCRALVAAGVVALFVCAMTPLPWYPLIVTHAAALVWARLLFDPPRSFWLQALGCGWVIFVVVECIGMSFLVPTEAQWVSGWVMLGVALATVTVLRMGWKFWLVGLPGSGVALWLVGPALQRMVNIAQSEGDFGRVRLWGDALKLMIRRPVLGVGPGNYLDYVLSYGDNGFTSAHGNYQQALAEIGVVGCGALVWVIWRSFRLSWNLHRSVDDPGLDAVAVGVTGGLAGVVAASVLGDYFIPAYHNGGHTTLTTTLYTWIMLGLLVGIEQLTRSAALVSGPVGPENPGSSQKSR
ncbi:MAG TPA: O-antigen ligase family protein, partial [Candidatus Acidoferrales bacterium]|nr:O-antigen ligase family protein [Candidatus Acidoferrales bacterium]